MEIISSIWIDADESIETRHRPDLGTSYLRIDGAWDKITIAGDRNARAEFFARLAEAATKAAAELLADEGAALEAAES